MTGRKYKHRVERCRRKAGTREFVGSDTPSNKRQRTEGVSYTMQHVTCFRCHQQGHYSTQCPNPPVPRDNRSIGRDRAGRGGKPFPGRGGRGANGGAYYLWIPHGNEIPGYDSVLATVPSPAPPPPFVSDESYPFFAGVLHDNAIFAIHQQCQDFIWIFDNGCTAHSASVPQMFTSLQSRQYLMYAANGSPMQVTLL